MRLPAFALTLMMMVCLGWAEAAPGKTALTFGLVAKSQSNPVFQAARTGAEQAAKDLGAKDGLSIRIDWRTCHGTSRRSFMDETTSSSRTCSVTPIAR